LDVDGAAIRARLTKAPNIQTATHLLGIEVDAAVSWSALARLPLNWQAWRR
jgi:hypothetical protein